MRKRYKMEGLCCANCTQKIEDGIKGIDGVKDARVVFMSQVLNLEVDDGADLDAILAEAQKISETYEEDARILV